MSESFQRINSIREANGSFDSCNSCKRLVPSRLHELYESKLLFISRIEFIRSKISNLSAHVSGVSGEADVRSRDWGGEGEEGEGGTGRSGGEGEADSAAPLVLDCPLFSEVMRCQKKLGGGGTLDGDRARLAWSRVGRCLISGPWFVSNIMVMAMAVV